MNGSCRRKVKMTGKKSLYGGSEMSFVAGSRRVYHLPKQVQEPKYLHDEPNKRPFEEYKQDAS